MREGLFRKDAEPRPFLKWVGGKGQLLDRLVPFVLRAGPFGRYHEPFMGGAALFFAMYRTGALPSKRALLSDSNERLTETFQAVKEDVEKVIAFLRVHEKNHSTDYYYTVRKCVPDGLFERAARIIYLNRTCYNGLFRENSRGDFNVPIGRYTNPHICDVENLKAVSVALRRAAIEVRSFDSVLARARPGDFVYFDPPYHPASTTASFTAYEKGGFGEPEQRALAQVFAQLDDRGVKVLLSNSHTPLVCQLYGVYSVDVVFARRAVNSRADRRGAVAEVLVRNY